MISDAPNIDAVLSDFFGRKVRLARAAPEDFTIEQYHPELHDGEPTGDEDSVTETKLGSAAFSQAGLPSAVPIGAFFDVFPVSVMTTSTLDQLSALRPESRFDQRRFRMNVIVGTHEPGFVENEWIDRWLHVGSAVRLRGVIPDARCVMTTLAQDDLPRKSRSSGRCIATTRSRWAASGCALARACTPRWAHGARCEWATRWCWLDPLARSRS